MLYLYEYDQTDSNFPEVCTSDAVKGQVVVSNFRLYCNEIVTELRAPLCVANDCDISNCSLEKDYDVCMNKNHRDEIKKYQDALTITTNAIASSMNNITGIEDCTVQLWFSASDGTTTNQNGMILLVTFISSAVFVAMTTLLF